MTERSSKAQSTQRFLVSEQYRENFERIFSKAVPNQDLIDTAPQVQVVDLPVLELSQTYPDSCPDCGNRSLQQNPYTEFCREPDCGYRRELERSTTDGKPPAPGLEHAGAPQPVKDNGQHGAYWVLSEEERAKGFVRPVRSSYLHQKCQTVTTMGKAIAETYARNPKFYGSTFCVQCGTHFPVEEFTWAGSAAVVGS